MTGWTGGGLGRSAVEQLIADSGVSASEQDAEAVQRSLARIETAAAALLQYPSFDTTAEQFYRLLEGDAAEGAGA